MDGIGFVAPLDASAQLRRVIVPSARAAIAAAPDDRPRHVKSAKPKRGGLKANGLSGEANNSKADKAKAHKTKVHKPKRGNAAARTGGKKPKPVHANGRGHTRTRYAGDASVATRHVKVSQKPMRLRPAPPPKAQGSQKPKAGQKLPGPFDTKPPEEKKPK